MPLVRLGSVAGRSPGDETAVLVMTGVLFFGISVYGQMVLTGVLEEKASRVVEVLLARIPPRTLPATKPAVETMTNVMGRRGQRLWPGRGP